MPIRRDARGRFLPGPNPKPRSRSQERRFQAQHPAYQPRTNILFIMDRSGSMQSCKNSAIDGFNEFIRSQKQLTPDGMFTLTMFSAPPGGAINVAPTQRMDVVQELNQYNYIPNGNTPLHDAIGQTVEGVLDYPNERYLCVIFTDGLENASYRYNRHTIADLIRRKTDQGNWTFVYLGANHDAYLVANDLHIPRGNTRQYEGTPRETARAYMAMAGATQNYTQSVNRATKTFFTTNLSNLGAQQVHQHLDNLYGQVDILPVPKEVEIQPFVEATGRIYHPGKGFYQLTKPEDVQSYKEVMVMGKGTKTVYGGQQARDLLGIPSGLVRITPGNHGIWDVFVQSHSTNRKLVRGTKLIYKK